CRQLQSCGNAATRIRYLIVINLLNGRSAYQTAEALGVHNTTVYRVARRFRAHGAWSLWDAREDNGETKLDEHFLSVLYRVVRAVSACWSPAGNRIAMVVHDWERSEDGKLVLTDPEKGNYRIVIMDTQGKNRKE